MQENGAGPANVIHDTTGPAENIGMPRLDDTARVVGTIISADEMNGRPVELDGDEIAPLDPGTCPYCMNGTPVYLGTLGTRLHWRCRNCGGDWSTLDPAAPRVFSVVCYRRSPMFADEYSIVVGTVSPYREGYIGSEQYRQYGTGPFASVRAALDEIPKGVMRRLAYQQFKRSYPEITDYGPDGSA